MIEWCQSTTDLKLKELWYVCGNAQKGDEDKPSWQSKPEKETLKRNTRNIINMINMDCNATLEDRDIEQCEGIVENTCQQAQAFGQGEETQFISILWVTS